jgi:hypothetical protein
MPSPTQLISPRKRRTGSAHAALIKRRPPWYVICRRPASHCTHFATASLCVHRILQLLLVALKPTSPVPTCSHASGEQSVHVRRPPPPLNQGRTPPPRKEPARILRPKQPSEWLRCVGAGRERRRRSSTAQPPCQPALLDPDCFCACLS